MRPMRAFFGRAPPAPEPNGGWYNTGLVLVVFIAVGIVVVARTKWLLKEEPYELRNLLLSVGVKLKRITKTTKEIERKLFHCLGLLVPYVYYYLSSRHAWSKRDCVTLCGAITAAGVAFDYVRAYVVPAINDKWPVYTILRPEERTRLCGCSYFSLGSTLAIACAQRPAVAVTALIYLALGDTAAALVGVAFGGETLTLGPDRRKSIEGSFAMFVTCAGVCYCAFPDVYLVEYAAVASALTATLVEVYQPLGVNDNLSIPVLSAVSLDLALTRIGAPR